KCNTTNYRYTENESRWIHKMETSWITQIGTTIGHFTFFRNISDHDSLFRMAPVATFMLSLVAWAIVPFDYGMVLSDPNIGLLYLFAISSLGVYGIIIAGWSSKTGG
uniref:NADH-ubiquinone oxidoreductase chain 1 n=1 Tax=Aegilops tauschii subsp. strangulata TaxID=200361 RepID=A0A452XEZ8_AEGTS